MSNDGVPAGFNKMLWVSIIKRFTQTTGIKVRIMDLDVNDWTKIKRPEFCKYMRESHEWRYKCNESDLKIAKIAWDREEPIFSECHAGFIKFAIPLFICNRKVVLIGGYVLKSEEDKCNLNQNPAICKSPKGVSLLKGVEVVPGLMDKSSQAMFARILGQVRLRYTLEEINNLISTIPLNLKEVLSKIIEEGLGLIAQPETKYIVYIMLLDEENKELFNIIGKGSGYDDTRKGNCRVKLGQGITGFVATTKEPYICEDVTEDEHYLPGFRGCSFEIKSEFAIPLICKDQVIGVINFEADKSDAFSKVDKNLFLDFASSSAVAIRNARLYEKTQRLSEAQKKFNLFWEKTRERLPLKELLNLAVSIIATALEAEICSLFLVDKERNDLLVLQATTVEKNKYLVGKVKYNYSLEEHIEKSFTATIAKYLKPIRTNYNLNKITGFLGIPLLRENTFCGVIRVMNKKSESLFKDFTEEDEKLLEILSEALVLVMQNVQMSDEIKCLQEKRIMREKLVALGEMAANVAHHISNPLGIIRVAAEVAKNISIDNESLVEELDTIMRNVDRVTTLRSRLLRFGTPSKAEPVQVNINQEIKKALDLLKEETITDGIDLKERYGDNLPDILLVQNDIELVFVSLMKNSIEAMPEGGLLSIESRYLENASKLEVIIKDTGCGMPEELKKTLFEPFVTTKKDGVTSGTGLGLSDSYAIIRSYGGSIKVDSAGEGKGCTFTIIIPFNDKLRAPSKTEVLVKFFKNLIGSNVSEINQDSVRVVNNMLDNASSTAKQSIERFSKQIENRLSDNLAIARAIFRKKGRDVEIKSGQMVIGEDYIVNNNFEIVDEIAGNQGIDNATIFQEIGNRVAMRISTNVKGNDGDRAINTIVSEPVYQKVIKEGKTFIGRAWVVKSMQLTAYEPIKDKKGDIVGILYIGIPEKDPSIVDEMEKTSSSWASFGENGYVFILDGEGKILFHPNKDLVNRDISSYEFGNEILERKSGWIECNWKDSVQREVINYRHFRDWDWIVCASCPLDEIMNMISEVGTK